MFRLNTNFMKQKIILHAIIAVSLALASCTNSYKSIGLATIQPFPTTSLDADQLTRVALVNRQITRHQDLVDKANTLLSGMDGKQRGLSYSAVGTKGGIASLGIASAALTAAAPAANAVWIQTIGGTIAGANTINAEMQAQQLTAAVMKDALINTATNLLDAYKDIDFDTAYAYALYDTVPFSKFNNVINKNHSALSLLEQAIVLKPRTYKYIVDQPGSADDAKRLQQAKLEEAAKKAGS